MADVDPSDAASVSTFAVTAAVGAIIILIALMCSVVRGNKDKSENGWSFICVLTDSPVLISHCTIFKEYNATINDNAIFIRYQTLNYIPFRKHPDKFTSVYKVFFIVYTYSKQLLNLDFKELCQNYRDNFMQFPFRIRLLLA